MTLDRKTNDFSKADIGQLLWNQNHNVRMEYIEFDKHCLYYGSGRETFSYYANKHVNYIKSPGFWRRILMVGVYLWYCKKCQSGSGHSRFLLK